MTNQNTIKRAPAVLRDASRRLFMRQASALSVAAGTGAPLAMSLLAAGTAAAETAGDYRAVVCLFMFGGNDSFNMVLPTDSGTWAAYAATRSSIALLPPGTPTNLGASLGSMARLGGVLPITPSNPQGPTYALHPLMTGMQSLFNADKRLAVVANVGPLVAATTKDQYFNPAHPRPLRLFSHNDQQSMWQTMMPEGATLGWGGRMADALASSNSRAVFTSISAAGNAVWLGGQQVRQYQVSGMGAQRLGADGSSQVYGSSEVATALAKIVRNPQSGHLLEADIAAIADRSIAAETILSGALPSASDPSFGTRPAAGTGYNPNNDPKLRYLSPGTGASEFSPLAHQLQVVARLVQAGMTGATGVRRQVFFVSVGGFDTHSSQNRQHNELMARVSHAMQYFDTALGGINARNNVTTFTASDFGRTYTSNGDGTDHGWGAHQFVMGGAVRGGDIFGTFPTLAGRRAGSNDFNSPDQIRNGALLPTTSVDQLGATLGRWFGLSDNQNLGVFPNLGNFAVATRNLGFMR